MNTNLANCLMHHLLCVWPSGPWPFSGPCVGSARRHRTAPAIDLCGFARVKSWIEMPKRGGQWLELGKTKLRKHENFANLDDQTTMCQTIQNLSESEKPQAMAEPWTIVPGGLSHFQRRKEVLSAYGRARWTGTAVRYG